MFCVCLFIFNYIVFNHCVGDKLLKYKDNAFHRLAMKVRRGHGEGTDIPSQWVRGRIIYSQGFLTHDNNLTALGTLQRKQSFFSGPATKRGRGVKAWPLKKLNKIQLFKTFFKFCSNLK